MTWQERTVGSPMTIRLLLERLVHYRENKVSHESGQDVVATGTATDAFCLEETEVERLKGVLQERFRSKRQHDLLMDILQDRGIHTQKKLSTLFSTFPPVFKIDVLRSDVLQILSTLVRLV